MVQWKKFCVYIFHFSWVLVIFTARRSYASAVLGVVILSVRPSVCHTRALWLIQRTYRRYFITHERTVLLVFCYPTVVGGRRPLPPKMGDWSDPPPFKNRSCRHISSCNVLTVRASEKSSIMTNRKSYTGFPMSYRWSAHVTSMSPKGWLKSELFLFWNKSQLQLNEVCYKVSLRKNFQRQSCSTLISLSNGT